MECNKDEASRAKEVAKEKMVKNDFEGARKIVLKAKQLFPELDNISQMIAVCDIHCSAQKMINGAGKDLYGILQVEKLADETIIRKQYRKLALVLHPDKNKFPGAEAAFKLIGEANMILSDKEKRSVYDMKCREVSRTSVTKTQNRQRSQTSNAGKKKFKNVGGTQFNGYGHSQQSTSNPNIKMKFKNVGETQFNGFGHSQQSTSNPNIILSFWTYCPFCNIKYEYSREFVNVPLRCQQCSKIFFAYDIDAPGGAMGPGFVKKKTKSAKFGPKLVFQQNEAGKWEKVKVNIQRAGQFSSNFAHKKTEDAEVSATSINKMKKEGVTKSKVNVQRPMETGTVKDMNKKRGRTTGAECNESSDASEAAGGGASGGPGVNSVDQRRSSRQKHVSYREDGDDEFSPQKRSKPMKSSNDIEDMKKEHVSGCEDTSDASMPNAKGEESVTSDTHFESDSDPELVDCPDQEFINFDKDKEEHCFAVDQIWACYDSVDGMPRFYAHIKKIYSSEFRLQITWLEPEPEDDLEIRWAEEGLPVVCGEFVHGETEETRDRLMFSHQIVYNKKTGSKFSCVISPQKGEIWALYQDWDINWSLDPEKKFKFDIVEILSVHDDCVSVAFLLKMKGFVSVFQRTIWAGVAERMIPSNERFRFSHRIPSAKLIGTERAGVPPGSFELDMASLPGDLEDYCYYYSQEEKVKPTTSLANTPKKHMSSPDTDSLNLRRSPTGLNSPKQENSNPCPTPEFGSVKVNDGQNSSSACGTQVSHDFRLDKSIWKFQVGQIWAFWEHAIGICQRYAVIRQIDSESFRLHVSLLKLYNKPSIGYNACGLFKVSPGKPKILTADSFSHIVKAEACGSKIFNIYPREQQIWALCKRQDAAECEIVEVVETDEVSIKVVFLTRVSGSKSVFKAPGIPSSTANIVAVSRVELNRFSHQIPAFLFTDGYLRGCWELDPAALTGLHLLEPSQV